MNHAPGLPASIRRHPLLGDWLDIGDDGGFDVFSGKVEIGQGISAALVKVACLALGVESHQVRLVAGDTARSPDEGYTSGSQSIEVGASALHHACVAMRRLCAGEALRRLGGDPSDLQVRRGVFSTGRGEQGVGYPALARSFEWRGHRLDGDEALPRDAAVDPADGPLFARADLHAKLGGAGFVHDLQLPGMLHARVLRGLHPAARPGHVDKAALARLDGVLNVVLHGDFLALVGTDEAKIVAAAATAKRTIEWDMPSLVECGSTERVLTSLAATTEVAHPQATVLTPPAGSRRLRRRYSRPYIAHAAIGPSCAVAEPVPATGTSGACLTIWSHTQGAFQLRDEIARALSLAPEAVRVIQMPGAGCYGHNGADDVAFDAAFLARALDRPVRVQWMRDDEMALAPMGAASLVELEAGLDADGRVVDWTARVRSHSHIARPGWGRGTNLLGAWACDPLLQPSTPADVPLPNGGGLRNAIPGYAFPTLVVQHELVSQAPMRVSALRSLGAHANVFAIESFMDELAALAGADPLAFRLLHMTDDRARHVLERVGSAANWAGRSAGGEGHGLGLGVARYKNHAGYLAVAIEVEVDAAVRVRRVWAAVDVGAIVHRDGLLNQIEGGIVQALSWCLKESVTWGPHGITSISWDDYPILGFAELPEVLIDLVNRPDEPSLGAGEVAPGPIAGALGNAVAHALGVRSRHLPFTPDRLLGLVQSGEDF